MVIAGDTDDDGWRTSSTASMDRRVKAAMLMEMALEALGFHNADKR